MNKKDTPSGIVKASYLAQIHRCTIRSHDMPEYTKEELDIWMMTHKDFSKMYIKYMDSGFKRKLRPSVDRVDNYKTYSLDNIRLVTTSENEQNAADEAMSGEGKMGERCKEVSMFTVRGEYIKTYKSISMASRENKINISNIAQAMKGLRKTAGGFTWKEEVYH